ncbi:MAG: hypothetical protein ACRERV_08485, partial [Methylococcales bacterium]
MVTRQFGWRIFRGQATEDRRQTTEQNEPCFGKRSGSIKKLKNRGEAAHKNLFSVSEDRRQRTEDRRQNKTSRVLANEAVRLKSLKTVAKLPTKICPLFQRT